MKRYGILLAGALVAAGAAHAGMGTSQFGLPQSWNMTATVGYGAQLVRFNGASAMCVECHTVNPSDRILQISQNGNLAIVRTDLLYRGSHTVMNQAAGGPGTTNSGGGFTGGFGNAPRDGGQYFRQAQWTSGATSKFGSGTGFTSVYEAQAGYGDATADMICESCHNVITNTVTNADNDLLVGTYQDNVNDGICLGCHSQGVSETSGAAAGYTAFHANDNLAPFAGMAAANRKRHHVLTGDTIASGNYALNAAATEGLQSVMWAPSLTSRLAAGWCGTGKYAAASTVTLVDLPDPDAIAFRNQCNVAGSGSRAVGDPVTLGDIVAQGGADPATINCSNCHRPHNAVSSSGAFILRRGQAVADSVPNPAPALPAGKSVAAFGTDANTLEFGIRRQSDVGSHLTTKVYEEYRPLCAGCHYGY